MLTVINTIITPTMNTLGAKDRTQYRTQILMCSFPKLRKSLEVSYIFAILLTFHPIHFIEVQFTYNIVLVSSVQHSDLIFL